MSALRTTAIAALAVASIVLMSAGQVLASPSAAARCAVATGPADQRVAGFWRCVDTLTAADVLAAEDLGQWARNVGDLDPSACIYVNDFRDSTARMQVALDAASAGIPPAPPKSPDVESRVATFWQRVGALGPSDLLAAGDLGQWALNVIDRDPSRRIRVDDFRDSTARMQSGFDRSRAAGASCKSAPVATPTPTPVPTPTPTPTPTPAPVAFDPSTYYKPITGYTYVPLDATSDAKIRQAFQPFYGKFLLDGASREIVQNGGNVVAIAIVFTINPDALAQPGARDELLAGLSSRGAKPLTLAGQTVLYDDSSQVKMMFWIQKNYLVLTYGAGHATMDPLATALITANR